jgi:GT2 family glycosyltransferase
MGTALGIKVSIIIPTYRDWERLALCLDALRNQTYPASRIEILVVNNDPVEGLPSSLVLPANARILQEARPGSYAARNRGLKEVRGDLIGFTDSDCVPEIDWVANAVSEAISQEGESFRITGPVRLFRNHGESLLAWKFESITAFNQRHNVRSGVAVTANLFVSRAVFERVGMFDAALFSGGDIAWNRLASQQGVALVYSDNVVVSHPARASMGEIVSKSRRVFGGEFVRARRERRLLRFLLGLMAPPVRYARVLIDDGKPVTSMLFACGIYWGIKFLMFFEIIRLALGGTPTRQ